jgi:hypothetical protein
MVFEYLAFDFRQCGLHRLDLRQDIDAVTPALNHLRDAAYLAGYAIETVDLRFSILGTHVSLT